MLHSELNNSSKLKMKGAWQTLTQTRKKNVIDLHTHISKNNIKILHLHRTFMKININLPTKKISTI